MSIIATETEDGRSVTIAISGRFDFSQHEPFRSICEAVTSRFRHFIVDLEQTEYMDSSALGMLLILRDQIGGDWGVIKIVNARPEVKKILQIANFDKLFAIQ